jgi:hypothetical protein
MDPYVTETWTAGMFKFSRVTVPTDMDDDSLTEWAEENLPGSYWASHTPDGSEVIFASEREDS